MSQLIGKLQRYTRIKPPSQDGAVWQVYIEYPHLPPASLICAEDIILDQLKAGAHVPSPGLPAWAYWLAKALAAADLHLGKVHLSGATWSRTQNPRETPTFGCNTGYWISVELSASCFMRRFRCVISNRIAQVIWAMSVPFKLGQKPCPNKA